MTYVGGGKADYNGHNYHAKWWTLNENPASSGQWACGPTTARAPERHGLLRRVRSRRSERRTGRPLPELLGADGPSGSAAVG
ncbi:hypothetical protein [Kitasatospora griseola]|uniref:hypothetical protein n=1 Tax=Kitasatospora griseola TaxID=2064 RepID=UPI003570E563